MIKMDKKPVLVDISKVMIDRERNVRDAEGYEVGNLLNDIIFRGQQDAATLEKIGDVYYPIKGFRRATAIKAAAEQGIVYAETAPEAGKPVDKILAIVHENLTERERTALLLDHGQRLGLNKAELATAFFRSFRAGYSEKDTITLLATLLTIHYAPSRKIDEDSAGNKLVGDELAKARLAYWKGVLQTHKRAFEAPVVLHEAFMKKLRGEQKWPSNAELTDLHGIHIDEMKADPANVSREKPGPKFMEKWNELVKAKAEGEANGTRPKSTSMRNRSQVEDSLKQAESLSLKAILHVQLGSIPVDMLPVLDRILVEAEKSFTPEKIAEIKAMFPKVAPKAD